MERESGVTLNHGILTMLQRNGKNPRNCYLLISYIRIRITIFNISQATLLAKGSKGHYAESRDSFDEYHPRSQVSRPLKLRGEEGVNLARNAVSTETGHYLS